MSFDNFAMAVAGDAYANSLDVPLSGVSICESEIIISGEKSEILAKSFSSAMMKSKLFDVGSARVIVASSSRFFAYHVAVKDSTVRNIIKVCYVENNESQQILLKPSCGNIVDIMFCPSNETILFAMDEFGSVFIWSLNQDLTQQSLLTSFNVEIGSYLRLNPQTSSVCAVVSKKGFYFLHFSEDFKDRERGDDSLMSDVILDGCFSMDGNIFYCLLEQDQEYIVRGHWSKDNAYSILTGHDSSSSVELHSSFLHKSNDGLKAISIIGVPHGVVVACEENNNSGLIGCRLIVWKVDSSSKGASNHSQTVLIHTKKFNCEPRELFDYRLCYYSSVDPKKCLIGLTHSQSSIAAFFVANVCNSTDVEYQDSLPLIHSFFLDSGYPPLSSSISIAVDHAHGESSSDQFLRLCSFQYDNPKHCQIYRHIVHSNTLFPRTIPVIHARRNESKGKISLLSNLQNFVARSRVDSEHKNDCQVLAVTNDIESDTNFADVEKMEIVELEHLTEDGENELSAKEVTFFDDTIKADPSLEAVDSSMERLIEKSEQQLLDSHILDEDVAENRVYHNRGILDEEEIAEIANKRLHDAEANSKASEISSKENSFMTMLSGKVRKSSEKGLSTGSKSIEVKDSVVSQPAALNVDSETKREIRKPSKIDERSTESKKDSINPPVVPNDLPDIFNPPQVRSVLEMCGNVEYQTSLSNKKDITVEEVSEASFSVAMPSKQDTPSQPSSIAAIPITSPLKPQTLLVPASLKKVSKKQKASGSLDSTVENPTSNNAAPQVSATTLNTVKTSASIANIKESKKKSSSSLLSNISSKSSEIDAKKPMRILKKPENTGTNDLPTAPAVSLSSVSSPKDVSASVKLLAMQDSVPLAPTNASHSSVSTAKATTSSPTVVTTPTVKQSQASVEVESDNNDLLISLMQEKKINEAIELVCYRFNIEALVKLVTFTVEESASLLLKMSDGTFLKLMVSLLEDMKTNAPFEGYVKRINLIFEVFSLKPALFRRLKEKETSYFTRMVFMEIKSMLVLVLERCTTILESTMKLSSPDFADIQRDFQYVVCKMEFMIDHIVDDNQR